MKLKRLFIAALLILAVFFIYLSTVDKKVYYLNLGDSLATGVTPYKTEDYGYSDYLKDYLTEKNLLEKYVSGFSESEYRTTDLIRDIEDNKKLENGITLKNALIKADLVTLSIGFNDLYAKIGPSVLMPEIDQNKMYQYTDEVIIDLEKLLKLLREYCKEDILMINYYNPIETDEPKVEEFFRYANKRLKDLCETYEIQYIDIYTLFEDHHNIYLPNPNDIHPSKEGYQAISDAIIDVIEKTLLKR